MLSFTEKVVPSALSASYQPAFVTASANEDWTTSLSSSEGSLVCTTLAEGVTIRVNPMARQYDGWNEAHFHSHLRLPMECSIAKGVVVTLEGNCNLLTDCTISSQPVAKYLTFTCFSAPLSICPRMRRYCSFPQGLL
jgi:hypothetical protein